MKKTNQTGIIIAIALSIIVGVSLTGYSQSVNENSVHSQDEIAAIKEVLENYVPDSPDRLMNAWRVQLLELQLQLAIESKNEQNGSRAIMELKSKISALEVQIQERIPVEQEMIKNAPPRSANSTVNSTINSNVQAKERDLIAAKRQVIEQRTGFVYTSEKPLAESMESYVPESRTRLHIMQKLAQLDSDFYTMTEEQRETLINEINQLQILMREQNFDKSHK